MSAAATPTKHLEQPVENQLIGSEVINVEVSGNLFKKRGGVGKYMPNSWQLRYFTIREGYLTYYDNQESIEVSRGKFDLREEFDMSVLGTLDGSPNNFTIQLALSNSSEEKWRLCAENKDDFVKWQTALNGFWGLKGSASRTPMRLSNNEYAGVGAESGGLSPNSSMLNMGGLAKRMSTIGSSDNMAALPQPVHQSPDSINNANGNGTLTPQASTSKMIGTISCDSADAAGSPPKSNNPRASFSNRQKRGIKVNKKASVSTDQTELAMVMIIVNIAIVMFNQSSSSFMSIFYMIVANVVVAQTLLMRAKRVAKASSVAPINPLVSSDIGNVDPASISSSDSSVVTTTSSPSPISPNGTSETEADVDISAITSAASSGKPAVGGTYPYFEGVSPNVPPHTWSRCDHRKFKLRIGPDYDKYKKKAPSETPLYEIFAVDVFCTDSRLDNVTQYMELPDSSDLHINNPHVPPYFCVQVQMPSDPPPMLSTVEDGPGWAFVLYFKMTQDTCKQLNDIETASPAVKLFAKWCENYQDPQWKARFKVIASCLNMEELGMPSMIIQYNAKPVLIRKTSTLYKTPKYLETTIHIFKFANLAKSSIHTMTSRCSRMFMEIGFTIEGRKDFELPECLIGCTSINKPLEERTGYLFN